jgi:hypothetical protein
MKLPLLLLGLAVCFLALYTYFSSPLLDQRTTPAAVSTPVPAPTFDMRAKLRLRSTRFEAVTDETGAIHGEIENVSAVTFPLVKVVATVYDRAGGIKTTGWALAESKPLLPRQRSPFTVWVSAPSAANFRIQLETAADEPIPFIDDPKSKN